MSIVKIAATKRKNYGAEGAVGFGTLMALIAASRAKNTVGAAVTIGIPAAGVGYTVGSTIKRNKFKQELKKTLHKKLSELRREHEP